MFVGVDGEGLTRPDDSHDYVLLATSLNTSVQAWYGGGLSSKQCFDFLIDTAKEQAKQQPIFVGFRFSYDVNMMLRDLPRENLEELHKINSTFWVQSKGRKYRIEYVPNKWLMVTRYLFQDDVWAKEGSCKVWDVWGFFQLSFVDAITDWQISTPDEEVFIAKMKKKRGNFAGDDKDEITRYCLLECQLLSRLMDKLNEKLIQVDLPIKQFHGAGAIANLLLNKHKVKDYIIRQPDNAEIWTAIKSSYFGGRIETLAAGVINRPVYNHDINSAYPSAMAKMPDLRQGKWRFTTRFEDAYDWALYFVRWNAEDFHAQSGSFFNPFPYRYDGFIYYPTLGSGWYHATEVKAALDSGYDVRIERGIIYEPQSLSKPFAWIEEIYETRRRYKDVGDQREKPLKLGINSLYGKLAQGQARFDRPGPFQCYYGAGFITANCRGTILKYASRNARDLLAISTDGVMCLSSLDVPISSRLGEWSVKVIEEGILLVQPGLILTPTETYVRTRGITKEKDENDKPVASYENFLKAWESEGITGKITVTDTRFATLGMALMQTRGRKELHDVWRRWKKVPLDIGFFPRRKLPPMDAVGWNAGGYVRLLPYWPYDEVSPYETASEEYRVAVQTEEGESISVVDILGVSD